MQRLSRRTTADGYGGVDRDSWQDSGKTEPDHVGPDSIIPNQRMPIHPPLKMVKKKRNDILSRRELEEIG